MLNLNVLGKQRTQLGGCQLELELAKGAEAEARKKLSDGEQRLNEKEERVGQLEAALEAARSDLLEERSQMARTSAMYAELNRQLEDKNAYVGFHFGC